MRYIRDIEKERNEHIIINHLMTINNNNNTVAIKVENTNVYIYPENYKIGVISLDFKNLKALYPPAYITNSHHISINDYQVDGIVYKLNFIGFDILYSVGPYENEENLEKEDCLEYNNYIRLYKDFQDNIFQNNDETDLRMDKFWKGNIDAELDSLPLEYVYNLQIISELKEKAKKLNISSNELLRKSLSLDF